MGNEANCRKFCDHDTEHQKIEPSQIKVNQYPIECQLCKKQVESQYFKRHLDLSHLATIEERSQIISVFCLLCEKSTSSLEEHAQHFAEVHPNFKGRVFSDDQKITFTNKVLKSKIKQIQNKNDFVPNRDKSDRKEATNNKFGSQQYIYKNEVYNTLVQEKEYKGIQYDEDRMRGEMVWSPIFCIYRQKAKYFHIDITPLQRSIHCRVFVFVQKSIKLGQK